VPPVGLWIDQFEECDQRWSDLQGHMPVALVPDGTHVKEGKTSGKWEPDKAARQPMLGHQHFLADWSEFDTLCFWCYAEKPTGARFALALYSDDPDTPDQDYYLQIVEVDWEGWRFFALPLASFTPHTKPVGWEKVDSVVFAFAGWTELTRFVPGTVLYFDAMYLAKAQGGDRLLICDPDTMDNWWPLKSTSELPPPGKRRSTSWPDTTAQGYTMTTAVPSDWSAYRHLHLWLHSASANNALLAVNVGSQNEQTQGDDCYRLPLLRLDWEGWKEVTLDLRKCTQSLQPVGWNAITYLQLVAKGYGATPVPGTKLHIGEMWLTKEEKPKQ
jgi:hypothetical protein